MSKLVPADWREVLRGLEDGIADCMGGCSTHDDTYR